MKRLRPSLPLVHQDQHDVGAAQQNPAAPDAKRTPSTAGMSEKLFGSEQSGRRGPWRPPDERRGDLPEDRRCVKATRRRDKHAILSVATSSQRAQCGRSHRQFPQTERRAGRERRKTQEWPQLVAGRAPGANRITKEIIIADLNDKVRCFPTLAASARHRAQLAIDDMERQRCWLAGEASRARSEQARRRRLALARRI